LHYNASRGKKQLTYLLTYLGYFLQTYRHTERETNFAINISLFAKSDKAKLVQTLNADIAFLRLKSLVKN